MNHRKRFTFNTFLPEADFGLLVAGGAYVNVHSVTYLDGEIRGQIQ